MSIKRLHELTKEQVDAVSVFMRGDIQPADITQGSTWVCLKLQRGHFWNKDTLKRMAENDKLGDKTLVHIALVEGRPVGLCWLINEGKDALLGMYLVDASYSQEEQWKIADEIAVRSITTVLADNRWGKGNFHGWFPEHGWAADYARRCGFRCEPSGTSLTPDPNPMLHWTLGMEELLSNIEKANGIYSTP